MILLDSLKRSINDRAIRLWGDPDFDPNKHRVFYRCQGCQKLFTARDLYKGPCGCGTNKLMWAKLSVWEELRMLLRLYLA